MALEKDRGGCGEKKTGGGLQSWNVRALPTPCVPVGRAHRQTDGCARADRDRSGSARRRSRSLENAAGAGNDGGEQEERTSLILENRGVVGDISAPNTMKRVGGGSLVKLFSFVWCCVLTFPEARTSNATMSCSLTLGL